MKNILKHIFLHIFFLLREIGIFLFIVPYALISRYRRKKIDVGLGPYPLINNIYHKKAIEKQGYTVETFAYKAYHITDNFDILLSRKHNINKPIGKLLAQISIVLLPFRYRILYIYFNGGPLGATQYFLWKIEPLIYKLAGIKTVVMPYGADVQDMSLSRNFLFKHAMTIDYPLHRFKREKIAAQIDIWTKYANHVISGCEWVDYTYHWDTLMIAHFSIDTKIENKSIKRGRKSKKFKILHAPNHRELKGTKFIIKAIEELKREGLDIELIMLEKVPNEKVIELIQEVDLVADQLIVGWYAMFAIEAMKHEKPVLCYLREDLIDLYTEAGLIDKDEIPIINANWKNIKDVIKHAYDNRSELTKIGKQSRKYVIKHHSTDYIGSVFANINKELIGK